MCSEDPAITVFGCAEGGEPLRLQKLELGAGEGGQLPWPRPAFGWSFLGRSNESFHPEALQTLTSRGGGWGLSPATGLAASDKNPREEFAAPFNTVIIFSAFYGWGRLLPGMSVSLPSERCPGVASLQDNFLGEP